MDLIFRFHEFMFHNSPLEKFIYSGNTTRECNQLQISDKPISFVVFLCFFQVTNENELFLLESNVLRTTEYCVTDLTYHVIYNTPRTTEYCVTDLTHHVIYNTPRTTEYCVTDLTHHVIYNLHYSNLYIYQLHVKSVPITTTVVGSNPALGDVYSIQHDVIKFVSDLLQVGCFILLL